MISATVSRPVVGCLLGGRLLQRVLVVQQQMAKQSLIQVLGDVEAAADLTLKPTVEPLVRSVSR